MKKLRYSDRQWQRLRERFDRTLSRQDGSYFFQNLPPGTYHIRCHIAQFYERVEIEDVIVENDVAQFQPTDIELSPVVH